MSRSARPGPKGLGVFARRAFAPGEFIFRRRHGLVVGSSGRAGLSAEDIVHLCELDVDRFAELAPPGCYLNHSCDPSAMRHGVVVFAWRAVVAGEEITVDYRLNALDGDSWPCRCGTEGLHGCGRRRWVLRDVGGAPAAAAASRPGVHPPGAPAAPGWWRRGQASVASRVMVVPVRAWLTGHPVLAPSAAAWKSSGEMPGT